MSQKSIRGAILVLMLLAATPALADEKQIVGVAWVIDGDTVEIHGQRIRLHGIDAPESSQFCVRPTGERWRGGQQGSFALADRIGRPPCPASRVMLTVTVGSSPSRGTRT